MNDSGHHLLDGLTRRSALLKLGGLAAVLAGGVELARDDAGAASAATFGGCVLTPELTEGPFYLPDEKVRRDITEGRPGTRLTLRTTVLDASTCRPIKNAAVDIWHCDAVGVYSGVQGNTGNFLRGIQRTDTKGLALFRTIYPGWYTGRAVHIHVKVHVGGNVVHTGQLFFSDALSDTVFRRSPYSGRGARDTRNADDSIYRSGGSRGLVSVRKSGTGYTGAITMGVRRS